LSKKTGNKQDVMAQILDRDNSFEDIIIPDVSETIDEILGKYGISSNPILQERLQVIKVLCIMHNEDYPNMLERMIEEGMITAKKVPSNEEVARWIGKEV